MATWQIDIEKNLGTEYWTNVYYVDAASQVDAANQAVKIVDVETQLHQQKVNFTKYRVRPYPAGGASGTVYALGVAGQRANYNSLPLFNTCNVLLSVATGRPSRKYYRLPFQETDQVDGQLIPAVRTLFNNVWAELVTDPDINLTDESGQVVNQARIDPNVGMRQLRRGSRRRLNPVI